MKSQYERIETGKNSKESYSKRMKRHKLLHFLGLGSKLAALTGLMTRGAIRAPGPMSNNAMLGMHSVGYATSSLFFLSFIIGSVLDVLKLRDLWRETGKYTKLKNRSAKEKQFKKVKTTAFLAANRLIELGFVVMVALLMTGVLTVASPAVIVIFSLMGAQKIVKYGYSLLRTAKKALDLHKQITQLSKKKTLSSEDHDSLKSLLIQKEELKHKTLNTVIKLGFAIAVTAVFVSMAVFAGPAAMIAAPVAMLLVVTAMFVYQSKIKPWLVERKNAKIAALKSPIKNDEPKSRQSLSYSNFSLGSWNRDDKTSETKRTSISSASYEPLYSSSGEESVSNAQSPTEKLTLHLPL